MIEKNLGDERREKKYFEDAINHYKNSILSIKLIFDEDDLVDEEKASELIEKIAVKYFGIFFNFIDSCSFKYGLLFFGVKRLEKCYRIL